MHAKSHTGEMLAAGVELKTNTCRAGPGDEASYMQVYLCAIKLNTLTSFMVTYGPNSNFTSQVVDLLEVKVVL